MENIYVYKEELRIISMALIISMPIILLVLYKILNYKFLKNILYIYIFEAIALFSLGFKIKTFLVLLFLNIIKISIIHKEKGRLKIKKKFVLVLKLFCFLFALNLIEFKSNMYKSIFMYILLNAVVLNLVAMNLIKQIIKKPRKYEAKIKDNKTKISKYKNKINEQFEIQSSMEIDKKLLEDEIKKSMVDSLNLIFILDLDGNYIYGNYEFEKFINNVNDKNKNLDIFNKLKLKFIDIDDVIENIKNKNTTIRSYDGKIFKFTSTIEFVKNKYINVCVLSDITESTLIKDKLRESEERFKKLVDILDDGIVMHSANNIEYMNKKFKEIFNIKDCSNKKSFIENVKISMSRACISQIEQHINLAKQKNGDKVTTKITTLDNRVIELITTKINLRESKKLLTIAIDITNIENVIGEIEEKEKMYKILLETLPQGVAIIEKKERKYIYRNKELIEILKEIGSDNLNKIIESYLTQFEYESFKRFKIPSSRIQEIEVGIIDIENEYLLIIRTLDNEYKIRKMEETLVEINNKYRFNVDFLANVSNDIKKPVTTIFETNKLIYSEDKDKKEYKDSCTKLIKQNCYRLMRLLDNILAIGQFENKTYKMEYRKYDIIHLLNDIVKKSKPYTLENGIDITFESNINKKYIMVDKEKIEKIVLNLISNSIKYTSNGGKINVKVECKKDKLYISVQDTGIGIPEDKLGIIFENFEQVDRTLTRGAEGSGIGLSLVKKLVNAHNGEIFVESEVSKGSKFTILLNIDEKNMNCIEMGSSFSDNEKLDIEFSDIYFNHN